MNKEQMMNAIKKYNEMYYAFLPIFTTADDMNFHRIAKRLGALNASIITQALRLGINAKLHKRSGYITVDGVRI